MANRSSLGFLSAAALLVIFMVGAAWYHNVLYHNSPGTVQAGNQPMDMSKSNGNMNTNASENKPNTPSNIDIPTLIKELNLPKDKLDKTKELVQNLLNEEMQASQNINGFVFNAIEDPSVSDQIGVAQRDFKNKFDLFQMDLGDLIGEQPAEKLANGLQTVIPTILLQSGPAPAMDMDM